MCVGVTEIKEKPGRRVGLYQTVLDTAEYIVKDRSKWNKYNHAPPAKNMNMHLHAFRLIRVLLFTETVKAACWVRFTSL